MRESVQPASARGGGACQTIAQGLGLGLPSLYVIRLENTIDPCTTFSSIARTWQEMTEDPLRNRRPGESPGHRKSPSLASPKLKEEEVVWGKTPDGEG